MSSLRTKPTLALFGSGEFTPQMRTIDHTLIASTGKAHPAAAIIPLAAGQETAFDKWVDTGFRYLRSLGAQPLPVAARDRHQSDQPQLTKPILQADLIYLSGGDPGYLLSSLSGSLLWQHLLKRLTRGAVLVGSSAGAMVLGRHVLTNPYQIAQNRTLPHWHQGLGLLPATIIPHYDFITQQESADYRFILDHTPSLIKPTLTGIDENTAVILTPNNLRVLGVGSLYLLDQPARNLANSSLNTIPPLLRFL